MSSSTSSSGSEGSVEFPVGGSSNRSNVDGDTCAYYGLEPGESCLKPRTCYDCLNVAVKNNPEGCVLSQFGVCQSMVYYDPSWDYRTNGTNADSGSPIDFSGGLYHQFPAGNSTYCEDTDPACLMCDALARNYSVANSFMAMTTKFCLGSSGCVCVLSCEESVWKKRIVDYCESSGSPSSGSSSLGYTTSPIVIQGSTSSSYKYLFWLIAIPALLLIGLALVGQYYCRLRILDCRRRRRLQIPISRRSPRDRLRLSAWRALNEELIENEKKPGDSTSFHIDPLTSVQ